MGRDHSPDEIYKRMKAPALCSNLSMLESRNSAKNQQYFWHDSCTFLLRFLFELHREASHG